ncbi:cobalamin biosynthesis protein [Pseudomonas sp. NPDC078416]|uniref:cobalamin biosynthesis protein n=1 Tax=Pseudomonas sp. NPDC078416 TaxID=3390637 RepID=UPI003D027716
MNDVRDRQLWVVGLGCQRGCSALELRQLIEDSLPECRLEPQDIAALASIDGKSDEAGLTELGHGLGLTIGFFSAAELAGYETQLSHRSEIAFERTGCYGVAESAALAMATRLTGSPATLIIPRRKSPHATFALASAQRANT